jgi:hypothetical protein
VKVAAGRTATVARVECNETRGKPGGQFPDFAESVIGPATSGRTRWLNPGYLLRRRSSWRCARQMG